MTTKRVFVTGASGCIGHYITETLIQETQDELFLFVRDGSKLQVNVKARPGITVIEGNLRDIGRHRGLLATMNAAVLIATVWGGVQETFDINVAKTVQLLELLDPSVCGRVMYFSTASILGRDQGLLKEAAHIGTDYIRSKSVCFQQLSKLAIAPRLTVLFPTLVFGGDSQKPFSHITADLPKVLRWLDLLKFLSIEGSFHFIHSQDIAQVVRHLLDQPMPQTALQQIVLGQQSVTLNQAIAELCHHSGKRIYFRLPIPLKLVEILLALLQAQMSPWDRFCLRYRHFTYPFPVNPSTFGLPNKGRTLKEILALSGIAEK